MSAFSNDAENEILNYILKNTAVSWAAGSDLWLALYSADPGEAGTAVTNEATYTGYARVALTKASDITIIGNVASNTNLEQFPTCTAGPQTLTHGAIVTSASGAGLIIVKGALGASLNVQAGIQPQINAGLLTLTLD